MVSNHLGHTKPALPERTVPAVALQQSLRGLCQVEAVEVHHLLPGRHKIAHDLLLSVKMNDELLAKYGDSFEDLIQSNM